MAQKEFTQAGAGGVTERPTTPDLPDFSDIILEVRMGKMKPMPGLKVLSGIDKRVIEGPVHVNELGIEGDEHDLTFHGGVDKALHGYCSSHYPLWRTSHPSSSHLFRPGAFGENLVLSHMSETNICIGDIYSVAFPKSHSTTSLLVQISLPRQPCFKLNHRFKLKNFAPNTYRLSRTGWYYRVLREGELEKGMEIRLVERKNPKWTMERAQEYLHRVTTNAEMNEELSKIDELGRESRGVFVSRVAKQKAKERKIAAGEEEEIKKWRGYRIKERKRETGRVVSFVLESETKITGDDGEEVELDEGAHVKVKLPNGLVRAYSIAGGEDKNCFQLGVAYDGLGEAGKSRGGSRYLHEEAKEGDVIQVGGVTAGVPIVSAASNHVFVVGGIGITAFLMLMETYKRVNYSFSLHYAVRSMEEVPFKERVMGLCGEGSGNLFIYDGSKGGRLDINKIVDGMPWNSQLYFCGPKRMMDEAGRAVKSSTRGIGEKEVHFEAFEADVSGDAFDAVVGNRKGEVVRVGEEETLLEKLQERFGEGEVASSCCVGNCGTCVVRLKSGRVDHRGTAMTGEETQTQMLACVSRGVGRIVIEI